MGQLLLPKMETCGDEDGDEDGDEQPGVSAFIFE